MKIEEMLDAQFWGNQFRTIIKKMSFRRKHQVELLEDLFATSGSGVPLIECFELFVKNYEGAVRQVSTEAWQSLNRGHKMASGLKGWYPDEVVMPLYIAEEQGILDKTLPRVLGYLQSSAAGLSLFVAKMLYPAFIFIIAYTMASTVDQSFYSIIKDTVPIHEWPEEGQTIYLFWRFVLEHFVLACLLVLLSVIGVRYALVNFTGSFRDRLDHFPIFKQYRMMQASIFLQMFGLLIRNVSPLDAIELIEKGASPYLKSHLYKMKGIIGVGHKDSVRFLKTGLLDKSLSNRLMTLSRTNDFEDVIVRMGEQTLKDTERKLRKAADFMGYTFLFIAGLAMASVVIGTMTVAQSLG